MQKSFSSPPAIVFAAFPTDAEWECQIVTGSCFSVVWRLHYNYFFLCSSVWCRWEPTMLYQTITALFMHCKWLHPILFLQLIMNYSQILSVLPPYSLFFSDRNPPMWAATTLSEKGLYKYALFLPALSPPALPPSPRWGHADLQECPGCLPWHWAPRGGEAGRLGAGLWSLECTSS